MIRKCLLAAIAALAGIALATGATAHDYKLGDLKIEHPWARASIGVAKAGAAYLVVINAGKETDRLVAAASPVAETVQIHTHLIEDGVAKMRRVMAVEVEPGEPAVLQPGGLHVMLMGLKAPLVEGEVFPLTLTFERAGEIEIEVMINAPAAGGNGEHGAHQSGGES